jgi:hypothetical protein
MEHSNTTPKVLPERLWASLPADDPRYTELRALLISIQRRGKHSPVARMLGEYALLGFLMASGKLALVSSADQQEIGDVQQQLSQIQSAHEHVSSALAGLDFE